MFCFPGCTLAETNIAPENRPSEKETDIPTIHFQGRALSFKEGKSGPIMMIDQLAEIWEFSQVMWCKGSGNENPKMAERIQV